MLENDIMSKQEMKEKLKKLATPIDFEGLIKKGVLKKKGAWYEILNMDKLPKHAKAQAIAMKTPNLIKFSKCTKSAEKLLKKISG